MLVEQGGQLLHGCKVTDDWDAQSNSGPAVDAQRRDLPDLVGGATDSNTQLVRI